LRTIKLKLKGFYSIYNFISILIEIVK